MGPWDVILSKTFAQLIIKSLESAIVVVRAASRVWSLTEWITSLFPLLAEYNQGL